MGRCGTCRAWRFVLFAAVGSKSTKQETVVAEQPQAIPSDMRSTMTPSTMTPSTMTPSTMTTVRGGHVFGVEIPSSEDSGPG